MRYKCKVLISPAVPMLFILCVGRLAAQPGYGFFAKMKREEKEQQEPRQEAPIVSVHFAISTTEGGF